MKVAGSIYEVAAGDLMTLRPLHDRIVVRRIEEGEAMRGGLFIPDSAKEKPSEGEIVSAGAGRVNQKGKRLDVAVKAGDKILFGKYSGSEVKVGGQDLLIMREDEILAILS
jgi:chaperonin GroES